jgi:hypothetical protein
MLLEQGNKRLDAVIGMSNREYLLCATHGLMSPIEFNFTERLENTIVLEER